MRSAWMALAALSLPAALVHGQATVELHTAQSCSGMGDTLTVTIDLTAAPQAIVSGQFFLTFDAQRLAFLSADPVSPWTEQLSETVGMGTIACAVSVPGGGRGAASGTMITMQFMALEETCSAIQAVAFDDPHTPANEVSDSDGATYDANTGSLALTDLPALGMDSTAPAFTSVPDDVIVQCGGNTSPAATGQAAAADACGPATVTYSDAPVPGCGSAMSFTRTWTATDACGNTAVVIQVVIVVDTIDPLFVSFPPDVAVGCGEDTSPSSTGIPTGNDACGPVTITHSSSSTVLCGGTGTITRTWTIVDSCGNSASQVQSIMVVDDVAPVFDSFPGDLTLTCGASTAPAATGIPLASDACGSVFVTFSDSSMPGCGNTQVLTRTWTATDSCGNAVAQEQLITVADTAAPSFLSFPSDKIVQCGNSTAPPATGTPVPFDTCSAVALTFNDSPLPGCGDLVSLIRVWTATDACGNAFARQQVIIVVDTIDPVFDGFPADITLACGADTSPAATGTPAGHDTCSAVTIDFADTIDPGCPRIITRAWTIADECGNALVQDQVITLLDGADPSFDTFPADLTLECGDSLDPQDTGEPQASDACGAVTLSYGDSVPGGCGGTGLLTRTWTVTDACGNTASADQLITIVDAPPVFVTFPADATVECGEGTSPGETGSPAASDACGDVVVSFSDSSTPLCAGTGTITRTWTVTDGCGHALMQDQIISVVDTAAPILRFFPDDSTVECGGDTSPAGLGTPAATDTCGGVAISFSDTTRPICEGTATITRTWTITDSCGNATVQAQFILVIDTTEPVFDTFPADLVLDCGDGTSPAATGQPTGSDLCSGVTIEFSDALTDACVHLVTRTWTISDDCGNFLDQDQLITLVDNALPVFGDFPPDLALNCGEDISPAATGTPVVSDDCGAITLSYTDVPVDACGATITRTWTAADACGDSVTQDQIITLIDTEPPAFDAFPADAVLECGGDTTPAATGAAIASDDCGPATVTFSDAFTAGCGDTGTITRTWSASDGCGNSLALDQSISVVDTTAPVFDAFPPDAAVECGDDTAPGQTGIPGAAADCSSLTLTFTDSSAPACGATESITRTWTVTDACGNFTSQDQIVMVVDTTAPGFTSFPADATADCGDDVAPAVTGTPAGSDTCGDVTISHRDALAPGCGPTITRTWTITDGCGNAFAQDQIITLLDNAPPAFDSFPADAAINCGADHSPAATGAPTASDDCGDVTISHSDALTPGCGAVITRTWTAADGCGNAVTQDQVITLLDDADPLFDTFPADAAVECGADTSPASTGTPTGSDTCGSVAITFSDSSTPACGAAAVVTRTWTATDGCGNAVAQDQIIVIADTTAPAFDTFPPDATVECGADTSPASTGAPTGSDTCGDATITFSDSSAPTCGAAAVLTRTWTITDACGNSDSQDQIVTVADTTAPAFDTFPANAKLECGDDVSPAATGTPTASDACGEVSLSFSDAQAAGCGEVILRTWTATDGCGNTAAQDQVITLADTDPPAFDTFPAGAVVECGADTSPTATGSPTGSDDCGDAAITFSDSSTPTCGAAAVVTRTWTVTDGCGNSLAQDQLITVADTTPPLFETFPADALVECGADTSPASTGAPTGSDTCGSVALTFNDSSAPTCGAAAVLTRTWTITDDCGNSLAQDQLVTITDTAAPAFETFPPDATVECGADTSPAATGSPTGSDTCGDAAITFSDSPTPSCGAAAVITRTWTIDDGCGNTVAQDQTITLTDTTPPAFETFPADATVECGADTTPASTGTPTGSDTCGAVTITFSDSSTPTCGAAAVVTRTWTAADACGNSTSQDQIVTVSDSTGPLVTAPPDLSVHADAGACQATLDEASIGAATAEDDCAEPADLTLTAVRDDGMDLDDPFPSGLTVIMWMAQDPCGNSGLATQTVTVSAFNEMVVDVGLQGLVRAAPFQRCVSFILHECATGEPVEVAQELTFSDGLALGEVVLVPCGAYECLTAQDRHHSLRRTDADDFAIAGTQYAADFSGFDGGEDSLVAGNLNDDEVIDILDFAIFMAQFGMTVGADVACDLEEDHADLTGEGLVSLEDFTFIQINSAQQHEADCCAGAAAAAAPAAAPLAAITVAELEARGLGHLAVADLDGNGMIDERDIIAFALGRRPEPPPAVAPQRP